MTRSDWLQSDGQIINRAQKTPGDGGVLWTIELPDGESFGVMLEKADAGSVTTFCEMVRNEWNERKEEQKAKARRKESGLERGAPAPVEEAVPVQQEATDFRTELTDRLARAQDRHSVASREVKQLALEITAMTAALEALNEQTDSEA